jgi:PKD repeat protein
MKNTLIKTFIIVTFGVIIIGCGKEPKADFTWEPQVPKAGQEVKFTNLSTNAKSYDWNFGDMSIGKGSSPVHVYKNAGNYIIDLDARNGLRFDEKTLTINVTN